MYACVPVCLYVCMYVSNLSSPPPRPSLTPLNIDQPNQQARRPSRRHPCGLRLAYIPTYCARVVLQSWCNAMPFYPRSRLPLPLPPPNSQIFQTCRFRHTATLRYLKVYVCTWDWAGGGRADVEKRGTRRGSKNERLLKYLGRCQEAL